MATTLAKAASPLVHPLGGWRKDALRAERITRRAPEGKNRQPKPRTSAVYTAEECDDVMPMTWKTAFSALRVEPPFAAVTEMTNLSSLWRAAELVGPNHADFEIGRLVTADRVLRALSERAVVILGTPWFEAMHAPNWKGYVYADGRRRGGHFLVLVGVQRMKDGDVIRAVNVWGHGWGLLGRCLIEPDTLDKLFDEGAEAIAIWPKGE